MALISALSAAFSIASSLKNLLDGGSSQVTQKLDQLLAQSKLILTGVNNVLKVQVETKLSEFRTDLTTAITNLDLYSSTGESNYRDVSIQKSIDALAGIIDYAANVDPVAKSSLAPLLSAAAAVREKIIWDLQDGTYSAEFVNELQAAANAFAAMTPDFRAEFSESFVINVPDKVVIEETYFGSFYDYSDYLIKFTGVLDGSYGFYFALRDVSNELYTLGWDLDGTHYNQDNYLDFNLLSSFLTGIADLENDVAYSISHYHEGYNSVAFNGIGVVGQYASSHNFAGLHAAVVAAISNMVDNEFAVGGGDIFASFEDQVSALAGGTYLEGDAGGATVDDTLFGAILTTNYNTIDGKRGNDVLIGSEFIDSLRGGEGNDTLFAGGGNDILLGGDDNDFLEAGTGTNRIDGGAGRDKVSYGPSDTGVIVSLDINGPQNTGRSTDTITNVEDLQGSNKGDHLTGDKNDNLIQGLRGDDTLLGLDGNDTLDGGADADDMLGGTGNDTYIIDNVGDTITETSGTDEAQSANLSINLNSAKFSGVENATLTGKASKSLTGDNAKNKLTGNDGKNKIDGQKGNDTLKGGKKADTFVFKTNYDKDKVVDFNAKGKQHDVLDIRGLKSVKNFKDLMNNHIEQKGKHVVIDGLKGDEIKLLEVKLGDLDAGDFLF